MMAEEPIVTITAPVDQEMTVATPVVLEEPVVETLVALEVPSDSSFSSSYSSSYSSSSSSSSISFGDFGDYVSPESPTLETPVVVVEEPVVEAETPVVVAEEPVVEAETPVVVEELVVETPVVVIEEIVVETPVVVIEEIVVETPVILETTEGEPVFVPESELRVDIGNTDTYSEVLTSEDRIVFRGEERPTPSATTVEQWAYENTENGKISWYIYGVDLTGGGLQTLGKVKELSVNFSEFTSAGIGLYYTIYTAPQFDGNNAGSFYRSRINYGDGDYSYFDPSATDVMRAEANYGQTTANRTEVIDGKTVQTVGLNLDPFSSVGPQKNTEIVSFIVISTASSQPAGAENWAIDAAQINFKKDIYNYAFRTIGEDAPNVSDDPNWDIVNIDLLRYSATMITDGPAVIPPVETASFVLTTTSPAITGVRVWQARTDTLVDPLEKITTSNPSELIRIMQNRVVYQEDVMYFDVDPEYTGDTYVYSYASWNQVSQPLIADIFNVSIDLGGIS
jgi:hypothetical protein